MKPKDVICLKDGVTSRNDYKWNKDDLENYIAFGIQDNPEFDANRARGLEKLIELVKSNPEEWSQFKIRYDNNLKRDVLGIVEKQNDIGYEFYVAYTQ